MVLCPVGGWKRCSTRWRSQKPSQHSDGSRLPSAGQIACLTKNPRNSGFASETESPLIDDHCDVVTIKELRERYPKRDGRRFAWRALACTKTSGGGISGRSYAYGSRYRGSGKDALPTESAHHTRECASRVTMCTRSFLVKQTVASSTEPHSIRPTTSVCMSNMKRVTGAFGQPRFGCDWICRALQSALG